MPDSSVDNGLNVGNSALGKKVIDGMENEPSDKSESKENKTQDDECDNDSDQDEYYTHKTKNITAHEQ